MDMLPRELAECEPLKSSEIQMETFTCSPSEPENRWNSHIHGPGHAREHTNAEDLTTQKLQTEQSEQGTRESADRQAVMAAALEEVEAVCSVCDAKATSQQQIDACKLSSQTPRAWLDFFKVHLKVVLAFHRPCI